MRKIVNIMIDLETLGRKPEAKVFAIGACVVGTTKVGKTFYCLLDPDRQTHRQEDADTVEWWAKQNKEARFELERSRKEGQYVSEAFHAFNEFLKEVSPDPEDLQFWGNGSEFDLTILESLFQYRLRWPFWQTQSLRTARLILPSVPRVEPEIAHHAMHDAVAQGKWLIAMQHKAITTGKIRSFLL